MKEKEWMTLEELAPDDQARARKLFSKEEAHLIPDYEFSNFGPKMLRRVQPAKLKTTVSANPPKASKSSSAKVAKAPLAEVKQAAAVPPLPPVSIAAPQAGEQVQQWPIERLMDCPFNPRKAFAEEPLQSMAATMRASGIIQPLVVREAKPDDKARGFDFEIVAGHRRKRSGMIARLATAPIIVRTVSDRDALDIMLCENLQREDLTPIEEAEALKAWLAMNEDDGSQRTVAMAAAKHGMAESHIGRMLQLLRVPKKVREALETGTIGRKTGMLIAQLPTPQLRERFGSDVLNGHGDGPLSASEAYALQRRNFMVDLRASPFEWGDANLWPKVFVESERIAGGACTDCPLNSANMSDADRERMGRAQNLCTNPSCYQDKVSASVAAVKQRALAAGAVVIEGERARRFVYADGTPVHDSGMVKLDQTPTAQEVVGARNAPTWKVMLAAKGKGEVVIDRSPIGEAIKGEVSAKINVPVTVVIDERGRAHEMVDRTKAIEAARKNGFAEMFGAKPGSNKPSAHAEQLSKDAEVKEKQRIESRAAALGLEELCSRLSQQSVLKAAAMGEGEAAVSARLVARQSEVNAWPGLLELGLFHVGSDGAEFVCQRRGIEVVKNEHHQPDRESALRKYAATLPPERCEALFIELLLAGWMKHNGLEAVAFVKLASALEIKIKALRDQAKAEAAERKKPGAKPKKEKAAKAKAAHDEPTIRERIMKLAEPRGMGTRALDIVAARVLGRNPTLAEDAFKDARGGELVAILDAVDDLTNYNPEEGWVVQAEGELCPMCGTLRRFSSEKPCVCGFNGDVALSEKGGAL